LFIGGVSKDNSTFAFTSPQNGFTLSETNGGIGSQRVGSLYKIVNGKQAASSGAAFSGSTTEWAGLIQTFKEFGGDIDLADSDSVSDQVLVNTDDREASDVIAVSDQSATALDYALEGSDAVALSDQSATALDYALEGSDAVALSDQSATALDYSRAPSDTAVVSDQTGLDLEVGVEPSDVVGVATRTDILVVSGADDYPLDAPIRIRIESDELVDLGTILIEAKFGTGLYAPLYKNETVLPPAGGNSEITATALGWDLSLAPFGFWPRNTLVGVRINADTASENAILEEEYSFTTADEPPLIRGITFIQAAIGRTP
jgi:hypothetical protein